MSTAIYYSDFIHRPYVLKPQRFEGRLFPRHQVYLLCWVWSTELASIGGPPTEPNRVGSPGDEGRAIPRNVMVAKHKDDG
jgi:hypothetical protein